MPLPRRDWLKSGGLAALGGAGFLSRFDRGASAAGAPPPLTKSLNDQASGQSEKLLPVEAYSGFSTKDTGTSR